MTSGITRTISEPVPQHHWLKKTGAFVLWLVTGLGLFGRRKRASEEIVVYAVHQSFFVWALIAGGFVSAGLVRHWPHAGVAMGWLYLWLLLYTLVTLLYDINTTRFMLWIGIFCFAWLGAAYMQNLKQVPLLAQVLGYFHSLRPELNPGFASAISWLLVPAWMGSLFHSFTQGRTTFTPNSVENVHMGHGNEIIDRSGLKFRRRYRDWFETVLGLGACDLEAIDGNGNVIKRWENVLFLAFTWKRLDEILHQRATVFESSDKTAQVAPAQ